MVETDNNNDDTDFEYVNRRLCALGSDEPGIVSAIIRSQDWYALLQLSQGSSELLDLLSHDKLWLPLFRTYFPNQTEVTENYKRAFLIELERLTSQSSQVQQSDWHTLLQLSKGSPRASALLSHDRIWQKYVEAYFPNGNEFKEDFKRNFLAILENHFKRLSFEGSHWLKSEEHVMYRSDVQFMLAAVHHNGLALQYANAEIQHDRKIVLTAVSQDGLALQYASAELQNDREVVLAAVRQNGLALQYASAELQNDREVVLAAVKQNGLALQYASAELQNDREVVLAAVRQNGRALQYANDVFKNDHEVVFVAVNTTGSAYQFVGDRYKDARSVIIAAVKENGLVLGSIDNIFFMNDREIVLAAVRQNGLALQYASVKFRNDREIVLAAVNQNSHALHYASDVLRNDVDIIFVVVKNRYDKCCARVKTLSQEELDKWNEETISFNDIYKEFFEHIDNELIRNIFIDEDNVNNLIANKTAVDVLHTIYTEVETYCQKNSKQVMPISQASSAVTFLAAPRQASSSAEATSESHSLHK